MTVHFAETSARIQYCNGRSTDYTGYTGTESEVTCKSCLMKLAIAAESGWTPMTEAEQARYRTYGLDTRLAD